MKTFSQLFQLCIVASFLFIGCTPNNSAPLPTSSTPVETPMEKTEAKALWTYTEKADPMTGEKRYFSSCVSTNEIQFEFPYNGGSTFMLIVRNMGKKNEVLLQVSKGQFIPSIGSNETVRVKFDDAAPTQFAYSSTSDGSADVIFIENATKFITQLKQSKKLMIEAKFFEAGNEIIYFDVAGLQWDKAL